MNEERDSQLSAMFDGELPEPECELMARRLTRDESLRRQWARYALIGSVIRGEQQGAARLAAGVQAALAGDRQHASHSSVAGAMARQRWLKPVAGLGIAAGVAALSVAWLRSSIELPAAGVIASNTPSLPATTVSPVETVIIGGRGVAASSARADQRDAVAATARSAEPWSYTTPRIQSGAAVMPSAQLANYLVAHSEFTPPLSRRSLLSALIATEAAAEPAQRPQPPGAAP